MTISLYSVAFYHIQSSCSPLIRFRIFVPFILALRSVVKNIFSLYFLSFFIISLPELERFLLSVYILILDFQI